MRAKKRTFNDFGEAEEWQRESLTPFFQGLAVWQKGERKSAKETELRFLRTFIMRISAIRLKG